MLRKQKVDMYVVDPVIESFRCQIDPRKNIAEFK